MKEYASVVLNGYTTKFFLDKALNELAKEGYTIHSTIMGNIIILEREDLEIEKQYEEAIKRGSLLP